jgi:hypothetical protein
LRRENELLRLNLEVVLEKVRAQEKELRDLRGKKAATQRGLNDLSDYIQALEGRRRFPVERERKALEQGIKDKEPELRQRRDVEVRQAEEALRALRDAKDGQSRRRALEALERALRVLREQPADDLPGEKKN